MENDRYVIFQAMEDYTTNTVAIRLAGNEEQLNQLKPILKFVSDYFTYRIVDGITFTEEEIIKINAILPQDMKVADVFPITIINKVFNPKKFQNLLNQYAEKNEDLIELIEGQAILDLFQ